MIPDDDLALEAKIKDRGLNAPRLNPAHVESRIQAVSYTILPSRKTMICEITLLNGFTVTGKSSTVSPENFDEEIGKEVSYKQAFHKIWELEGYLLAERLYRGEIG